MPNFHASVMMPRADMPQIAKKDVPGFLDWMRNKTGKSHSEQQIFATRLKPTQSQIDDAKVSALGPTPDKILVSADNYVLDGHHRWVANARNGSMQNAYVLPFDVHQSFKLMKEYPGSFTASLNEEEGGGAAVVGAEAPTVTTDKALTGDVAVNQKRRIMRRKKLVEWLSKEYA